VNIGGIEIPPDSPPFLAILAVHIPLALAAVVTGIGAMLSSKRRGQHSTFGTIYFWCLAALVATSAALALMRWAEDYHLFILGAVAFSAAWLGRTARRQRWSTQIDLHIVGMGVSYIVMLTAFYVDNGKNLPIWRDLPYLAYWLVPSAVGIPLIVRSLRLYSKLNHHAQGWSPTS
jgi:FtsH-binding integral membrane protein